MRRFALVLLLLTACGGAATTTSPPPTTTPATTATTTPGGATTTSPTPTTVATRDVQVFFGVPSSADCSEVAAYPRTVPTGENLIGATFEALLAGPTDDEKAGGAYSFFGPATDGYLRSAALVEGALTVDFTDFSQVIPNASSSCGSGQLLSELTSTAFQFSEVVSVTYTFEGSCEAFGEFVQMGCVTYDRSAWPPITITTTTTRYKVNGPDITLPPPLAGSTGASGSGCEPGPGALPAGAWAGFIREIGADWLDFDLACFFVGDAANTAAAEDGVEEIPVPNDYYIRNANPAVRRVPVAAGATVYVLNGVDLVPTGWDMWVQSPAQGLDCPGDDCLVWLYVNDGEATEIVEQYRP
jgi:hypothetical protein